MQRVVLLFAAILSVVRASPFGLDSDDRPTPFRYTFRVEKVEFGDDEGSEYIEDNDNYYTDSLGEGAYSDVSIYYDSIEYSDGLSFADLFGALDFCEDLENEENPDIPEEGCIYLNEGNVHLINVLNTVDVDEVYKALEDVDIEECDMDEIREKEDLPEGGCFFIQEELNTVHFLGVYDDDSTYDINDLEEEFGGLSLCDTTLGELPEEPCVVLAENVVGFINVLEEENIETVIKDLAEVGLEECEIDLDEHKVISTDICYVIDKETNSLIIANVDEDESEEYEIDEDSIELPGADIEIPPSVEIANSTVLLQKLKFKGFLNRRSSAVKKSKAAFMKNIKSRQAKGARGNGRHRDHRREGKVNHLPKWMRHL